MPSPHTEGLRCSEDVFSQKGEFSFREVLRQTNKLGGRGGGGNLVIWSQAENHVRPGLRDSQRHQETPQEHAACVRMAVPGKEAIQEIPTGIPEAALPHTSHSSPV